MRDDTDNSDWGIDRRTVLRGAAAGAGIAGMSGLATAGDPCFKDFECSDDATYVKFEFVIETDDEGNITDCYFEEETDTGLITIDSYTSKEGDCEPISVEWSVADGYGATKVMAYGGQECVSAEDPDPDQSFEPELEGPSGKTAAISNLQFCVEKLETVEVPSDSYIGYEDRPKQGDFDYNDFGMRASITETYLGDELQTIDMEFSAEEYQAGDSHVISIQRDFLSSDTMEWEYELSRSGADDLSSGRTTDETSGTSGSGLLEVALFDTDTLSSKTSTIDDTVSITVTITSGTENPPSNSPRPDVAANNDLFEVYDTVMEPDGANAVDLGTVQSGITESDIGGNVTENWDNVADVPNIIVVPDVDFVPPAEATTISTDYPEFDDYYAGGDTDDGTIEVDDTYEDWFDTS